MGMIMWLAEMLKEHISDVTFWQGVMSSIVVALIAKLVQFIGSVIRNAVYRKYKCSLQGYWLTVFKSYSRDATVIELYRIRQKNSDLQLNIQHYSSNNKNPISVLQGKGIIRESEVACYYSINNKKSSIVGGLLFQIKRCDAVYNCLSGKYVQLNNMADTHKDMYDGKRELETYIDLYQVEHLSIWKKLCLLRGKPAFKNYLEAQIFAEKENRNERFCL